MNLTNRLQQMSDVAGDPPLVHEGAPGGVWGASNPLYEFLAVHVQPGSVTLETGLGMSTLLFSMWAGQHVCVVGSGSQVDALRSHAEQRQIDLSNVRFEVGSSDQVLPTLRLDHVDLYLVDGGHGFPHPAIDWYYGALMMHDGGIVVIDDIQLRSVREYLVDFLEKDPRWVRLAGDHKWVAYRKQGDFSVREEWTEQRFLGRPRLPVMSRLKISVNRALKDVRWARNRRPSD